MSSARYLTALERLDQLVPNISADGVEETSAIRDSKQRVYASIQLRELKEAVSDVVAGIPTSLDLGDFTLSGEAVA